jgi:HD-GYP domain-containing protein (c-di-GMP phosphodiesterase class II)
MPDTRKVPTEDLQVGMFVSQLDRPWVGTPFPLQGFRIANRDEIVQLQGYCKYVMVDIEPAAQAAELELPKTRGSRKQLPVETIFFDRSIKSYKDKTDFMEEHSKASAVVAALTEDVEDMYLKVTRDNKVNVVRLKQSIDPMVGSISRNPDACVWVARLKRHDQYTYERALSAGIWAVALGRELGLPKQDLRSLGVGGMLMDVGMLRVDPELLGAQRPLTAEETAAMRKHIDYSLEIIQESGIMNRDILDMAAHHHERYNGSGYPRGLAEDRIPTFARIAGLVDAYGALTTDRDYAPAVSPAEAMRILYEERDIGFQAELVEAFIRAVGIYPAGTLVELSDGSVAVVVAEYRAHRLRPTVLQVLDQKKRRLDKPQLLKLQAATSGWLRRPMPTIKRALEPGAFGVDLQSLDLHRQFGI